MFGCTYRTPEVHLPSTFSGFRGDQLELVDVAVHDHGKDVSPETALNVKSTVREMLVGAAADRATSSDPPRVTGRVNITRSEDWMANIDNAGKVDGCGAVAALPFMVAVPLGAKTEDEALVVELDIERSGRHFWGRGSCARTTIASTASGCACAATGTTRMVRCKRRSRSWRGGPTSQGSAMSSANVGEDRVHILPIGGQFAIPKTAIE